MRLQRQLNTLWGAILVLLQEVLVSGFVLHHPRVFVDIVASRPRSILHHIPWLHPASPLQAEKTTQSSLASTSPSEPTKKAEDEEDEEGTTTTITSNLTPHPPTDEEPEPDLFDYFDPLLSPHAYPHGISPATAKTITSHDSRESIPVEGMEKEESDPLRLDNLEFLAVPHPDPKSYRREDYDQVKLDNLNFLGVGTGKSSWPRDHQGLPIVETYASTVFDPTLSPHVYSQGTPAAIVGDDVPEYQPSLVGILLIDHGSKNEAANQRLQDMATLYQQCVSSVVVEAAHMEIARPSIQEGMERLMEQGVDEIVCHPYFLGSGRHVSEDIPRLIEEAMENLDIEIPVRTTAHVGSDMTMMLEAVHALVQQSSTLLTQSRTDHL